MKRHASVFVILLGLVLAAGGCAWRHYMGLHGPSIRRLPEIHAGITADADCLGCHDPARQPSGPPTSHPGFKGCLKCHNDPLE